MATNSRNFPATTALYDVTIPALAPNSSGVQTPVSGAVGADGQATYAYVTPNVLPNNSSALPSGLVAEALYVEVTSPVVQRADGSIVYPDFNWWFVPDFTDLQKQMNFDGSFGSNMMPPRESTVGRQQIRLGISMRRLLTEARNVKLAQPANKDPKPNLPLMATGLKFVNALIAKLASTRGWGIAGDTVITPARIRVWGERYTADLLDALGKFYTGTFTRQSLRRDLERLPAIKGTQGGQVTMAGWTSLPGGYDQKRGSAIHRYFNYASNLQATGAQSPYILSNNQGVGGAQGNVDLMSDLGFPFAPVQGQAAQAKDVLILQQFGVVAGVANIAWAGIQVGGASVPDPNGFAVGTSADRLAYGQVGPIRSESGLYYALPDYEGELEIFGENAAVQITANGTPIAAGAARVALGGVRINLA